ncbi:hypothetical protein H2203_007383 [Taxawa tesnikishii (nom. ined.)]|nr:hypothetical protein H2203_007383 [Dothideales sp. JES 119]
MCDLQRTQIDGHIEYEALSYCWGNPSVTVSVLVNGVSLQVTKNLAAALRALRSNSEARILWIDAICINQDDLAEKNSQVPLMGKIYTNSSRTIVWLGESDTESRRAFDLIQKGTRYYSKSINPVLRNPWFRRIWIVQEVALAPSVIIQCGRHIAEWNKLIKAASVPGNDIGTMFNPAEAGSKHLHPSFYPMILDSTRNRVRERRWFPLREALRAFQPFDATKPVDKIFGIMGLIDDPDLIRVDYDRTVQQVYHETALRIINQSQSLELLLDCLQTTTRPNTPGLPSWVPDWSATDQPLDKPMLAVLAEERFAASQATSTGQAVVEEDGSLKLSGHVIGRITELGRHFPTISDMRERYWPFGKRLPNKRFYNVIFDLVDIFLDWKDVTCRVNQQRVSLADTYPTGETLLEAFYHTVGMTGAPFSDIEIARDFDKWITLMELWLSVSVWYRKNIANRLPWLFVYVVLGPSAAIGTFILLFKVFRGQIILDAPETAPDASRQHMVLGRIDRAFDSLIGLFPAPGLTAPNAVASCSGDTVVVFKGGARPFVLRRHEDKWRLIGDCYVHGIMYGAAFEEDKCVDIHLV